MIVASRNGNQRILQTMLEHEVAANRSRPESSSDSNLVFLCIQSARKAAKDGHQVIIQTLYNYLWSEDLQFKVLTSAMRDAVACSHYNMITPLRIMARPEESTHLSGTALVAMSSTKKAHSQERLVHDLGQLFNELVNLVDDPQTLVDYQLRAIREALRASNYAAVYALIEKGSNHRVLETESDILQTALRAFSINWNRNEHSLTKLLELLISHGAPVNSRDGDGKKPLYHFCVRGDVDMFDTLVNSCADPWASHDSLSKGNLDETTTSAKQDASASVDLLQITLDSHLTFRPLHNKWGYIVMRLLDIGMVHDPRSPSLVSFLHISCIYENVEFREKVAFLDCEYRCSCSTVGRKGPGFWNSTSCRDLRRSEEHSRTFITTWRRTYCKERV